MPSSPRSEIESPPNWEAALRAARAGEVGRAREICGRIAEQAPPFAGAHEYLLGRCLAEGGEDLDESLELIDQAITQDPKNLMAPHVRTLARLRSGKIAEAAADLRERGMPHDHALLTQITLTLESQIREPIESLGDDWPALPDSMARSMETEERETGDEPDAEYGPRAPEPDRDEAKLTRADRKRIAGLLSELENEHIKHGPPAEIVRRAEAALDEGLKDAGLHLIAGIAAEEGDDLERARFHLSKSLALEPTLLHARTYLGRAYWRAGWDDLAEGLFRSLPVEGPDDSGRHYHLALVYYLSGRGTEALEAMSIALRDFFIETREYFIERAQYAWLRRHD